MILLHLMGKEYGRRPSEIVGIADEWAAFDFDAAVFLMATEDPKKPRRSQPSAAQLAQRKGR